MTAAELDARLEPTTKRPYHAYDDTGLGCECGKPYDHPVHGDGPGDGLTPEQRSAEYHNRLNKLVWR